MKNNYRTVLNDPYRGCQTTYLEFAKAEGCKKMAVYFYHKRHGSLEGFRDRPKTGNGIKPHTFIKDGKFITIEEARRIAKMGSSLLGHYANLGICDVDEIMKIQQKRREESRKAYPTDDGRMMTQAEYAQDRGVTYQTVAQYVKTHGILIGFTQRGHSRVNPKRYPHEGLGVSKTVKEWSRHFGCPASSIKIWLISHDKKMDGFEYRTHRNGRLVEWNGRTETLSEWARILGVPTYRTHNYYQLHKTLEGFGTRKRVRTKRNAA